MITALFMGAIHKQDILGGDETRAHEIQTTSSSMIHGADPKLTKPFS